MKKFNFYCVYLEEMNTLNPFQFKKLVNAICEYSKDGRINQKLSKKAWNIFTEIQRVVSAEKNQEIISEIRRKAGKRGARNRWKNG